MKKGKGAIWDELMDIKYAMFIEIYDSELIDNKAKAMCDILSMIEAYESYNIETEEE